MKALAAIIAAAALAAASPAFAEKGDKGYVPAPNTGGGKAVVVCVKDAPCPVSGNGHDTAGSGGAGGSGGNGGSGKGHDGDGKGGDHDGGGKDGHD